MGPANSFSTYSSLPNWQELIGSSLLKVNSLLEKMKGGKKENDKTPTQVSFNYGDPMFLLDQELKICILKCGDKDML